MARVPFNVKLQPPSPPQAMAVTPCLLLPCLFLSSSSLSSCRAWNNKTQLLFIVAEGDGFNGSLMAAGRVKLVAGVADCHPSVADCHPSLADSYPVTALPKYTKEFAT